MSLDSALREDEVRVLSLIAGSAIDRRSSWGEWA